MEKVKLPRSSYEEIKKIIIAYGSLGKPATLYDISHSTGMNRTVISANNAFLTLVEIIEGGNKKTVTSKGARLARALEHEIEEEMHASMLIIINENDFLTKMLQAVKIRKGMDISQLENHIAFSSGEPKTSQVMTGARAVVDILLASGQLRQDGDRLIINNNDYYENSPETITPKNDIASDNETVYETKALSISKKGKSGVNLNIELSITATPNELEGLGKKIKSIFDDLNDES